ncbi:MAG TPA: SurA N-terminal domain-containing protein [Gaiellaceae bacterium]|nr:SurA N-terminal domain-containing protein [Gaiellaceae bacterium]
MSRRALAMQKTSVLSILLVVTAAAALAGCGGGGSKSGSSTVSGSVKAAKLNPDDVVVVGNTHITQDDFTGLMNTGKATLKQQGQTFPKQGTTAYEQLKGNAVTNLLEQAELNDKAAALGIKVTDADVQKRLTAIIKQYYSGSRKKYETARKAQGVTDAYVLKVVRNQLIDQALYNRVTKNVKVGDAQIDTYFRNNPAQFPRAATSRKVRHILVKKKSLATSIYNQLKKGDDKTWCTLAKKYSQDPSSKNKCGVLTVTKGETVAVFDKVAFSEKTGVVHAPVYDASNYKSYFVIEPLGDIKPGATKPTAAEKAQISSTLSSTKKNTYMNNWVKQLQIADCKSSSIAYATGYKPSPDICTTLLSTTTSTSSTTTG